MISRGSEWGKWNLHMHSMYSRENRTKMKIDEIFDIAVKNEIKMIAITDHSNFDALDEIWNIYENGSFADGTCKYKDCINFLPGIELKTNKGKRGVHIISIFPREIEQIGIQLKEFGVKVSDVVKFTVDKDKLIQVKELCDKNIENVKDELENQESGLCVMLQQKTQVKEKIIAEENRNIELYDTYIKEYQDWDKVKQEKEENVRKIETELNYIEGEIEEDLVPLYQKRKKITDDIFAEKKKIIDLYNKFKKPVDEFLTDKADLLEKYSMMKMQ